MKKYINNYGLLCFTVANVDYISKKGDTIMLPSDSEHVKMLVARKYIVLDISEDDDKKSTKKMSTASDNQ